ncbi:run domain Beclin-1-interacting and cysteine-rich domain-containing protein-like isoform X2 [Anneissia japonica]|uniref:run domain Beclin-1-interacting and cysteine-rich domain-containing protein-like isoform X2 n=1 Tax=Anneissia japonica TaxID=1529436 RepID=UPI001425B73B|nr:run domain Beclin-1-interacting and cysteine-rich domain-containing protein-like isoform X2 [Anneissia japonica]
MASVSVSNIKQLLSEEIAAATKKLQKDHIGTDSAIRSGDTANRICNVLEAIFLHELKESIELKAFWPLLVKFTHRDVYKQIEGLSQITTDIGRCRAWIRLALNDCLFESYMDAMLRDGKAMKQFYKKTAYIRDVEHPEIMRKCAQGLSNFYFQLSFNSSVLNMWGSSPKMLTGRWQPPIEKPQTNSPTLSQRSSDGSEENFGQKSRPPRNKPRKSSSAHKTETKSIPPQTMEKPNESMNDHSSFRECEMSSGLLHTPSEGSSSVDSNQEKYIGLSSQEGEEENLIEQSYSSNTVVDGNFEADNDHIEIRASEHCSENVNGPSGARDDADVVDDDQSGEVCDSVMDREDKKVQAEDDEFMVPNPDETLKTYLKEESNNCKGAFDSVKSDKSVNVFEYQQFPEEDLYQEDVDISPLEEIEDSSDPYKRSSNSEEETYSKEEIFGNSLGARGGWSSQFDNPSTSKSTKVENGESYTSLFNSYSVNSNSPSHPSTADIEKLVGKIASPGKEKKVQQLLAIVTQIAREKGLDNQNYQCKGCSRPIGIIYGKARVCSYDACYYCNECHLDDEAVIPARILHNWDFHKHKVASYTKMFLQQMESYPLIDISLSNPRLYEAITEVQDIKVLRTQLKYLKAYLFTCKESTAEELKKRVWPREYMLDHAHLYSVQDMHHVQSGQLAKDLKKVINWAAKHVYNCILCRQKGFICEICDSPKVIYPFDVELTTRCETCKTVFHKACKKDHQPCSKCTRIKQRRSQLTNAGEPLDFASPWS